MSGCSAPDGGELAGDGGFEECGAVALEVGLGPLERRHAGIEVGEEFFDLRHNPPLLVVERREQQRSLLEVEP
jgi:hypothetical protein